ncbi:MAG: hypothetical protein Q9159_002738 [Coniocarpon cinnabarinum]
MSSSQPFVTTSPISPSTAKHRRLKSRFSYKSLFQLANYSVTTPLRCIAHIDLDAFYAQCEMVRLGVPEDRPLAVQQWQGLIAINYPARAYGLNRHVTIQEAQQKCPEIIVQHVATWKEGELGWAYREDAYKNSGTHKVSLDPYRLQSRRILALIKDALPAAPMQKVEKASIDEVYLDLSTHIHRLLLERYPELRGPPPYEDPTEQLPAPPTTALEWNADALVDLDEGEAEEDAPDWDDIVMLLGSEIVRDVRNKIREKLGYTCSAGVARNKMLAKLGSGHKKPNNQTIIRNRAVQNFLSDFKFTKIRNLGGKLGDEVVNMFQTDSVQELLQVPMEQMKKLGDDTGSWLHQTIRGEDHSEVNSRTQIKSMLSAKSFRPSINTFEHGCKWLRIFVADIYARLVEEGVLENKRRPKTMNLHHRQGAQTRSKQSPIPQGKTVSEDILFDLGKSLLAQVVVDGRAWPCANLSLSVGGFEDGPTGNRGIGGFLVKGEEAKALQPPALPPSDDQEPATSEASRPAKRRRTDDVNNTINAFFTRQETSDAEPADFEDVPSAQPMLPDHDLYEEPSPPPTPDGREAEDKPGEAFPSSSPPRDNPQPLPEEFEKSFEPLRRLAEMFWCEKCRRSISVEEREEHTDWHFARELQREEQTSSAMTARPTPQRPPAQKASKVGRGRGRPPKATIGSGGSGRGQSRLTFG